MARKSNEALSENDVVLSEQLKFDIQYAIAKVMREKGITRSQLAERMKATPSRITKLLGENENLTIETIARVFSAIEDEPVFSTKYLDSNAGKLKYAPKAKATNGWADTLQAEHAVETRVPHWTPTLYGDASIDVTLVAVPSHDSMMQGFMNLAKQFSRGDAQSIANHNDRLPTIKFKTPAAA